jgi:hypothetical protein
MGDGATAPMAAASGGQALPGQSAAEPRADNRVLPNDYARIAAQLERRNIAHPDPAAQPIFGAGEARLAYLMLASFGLSTGGGGT